MSYSTRATAALGATLAGGNYDGIESEVKRILESGANPNGQNCDGSPLRKAITLKSAKIVSALLAYGADPNLRMQTLAQPNADMGPRHQVETAFQHAIYQCCWHDPHYESNLSKRMLLELIAAGADRDAKTYLGMTCIDLAKAITSTSRTVQLTLALPLHAAISLNDPDLCLRLLGRGIDPQERNARRQTAWRNAELNSPECHAVMSAWKSKQTMALIAKTSSARINL